MLPNNRLMMDLLPVQSAGCAQQLVERLLHAFGVVGGVWQRAAVGGRADGDSPVVARDDVEEVHPCDQRTEPGDACESSAREVDRLRWPRHVADRGAGNGWSREG